MVDHTDPNEWHDQDDELATPSAPTGNSIESESVLDAFDVFTTDLTHLDEGLDLHSAYTDVNTPADDETGPPSITAANPPGTVSVSALFTGEVREIVLSPQVIQLSEAELATEIESVADVAVKKATAAMYTLSVELLAAHGVDREAANAFMQQCTPLATPAEAYAAESTLAARYVGETD